MGSASCRLFPVEHWDSYAERAAVRAGRLVSLLLGGILSGLARAADG
jgi:hypothetical protein